MPDIVDPRPWLKAELAAKEAELEATTDAADRTRLSQEIDELRHSLRPPLFRWFGRHVHW